MFFFRLQGFPLQQETIVSQKGKPRLRPKDTQLCMALFSLLFGREVLFDIHNSAWIWVEAVQFVLVEYRGRYVWARCSIIFNACIP